MGSDLMVHPIVSFDFVSNYLTMTEIENPTVPHQLRQLEVCLMISNCQSAIACHGTTNDKQLLRTSPSSDLFIFESYPVDNSDRPYQSTGGTDKCFDPSFLGHDICVRSELRL